MYYITNKSIFNIYMQICMNTRCKKIGSYYLGILSKNPPYFNEAAEKVHQNRMFFCAKRILACLCRIV